MSHRTVTRLRAFNGAFLVAIAAVAVARFGLVSPSADEVSGILKLRIVDAGTRKAVPARVEVMDAAGKTYVAEDALQVGNNAFTDPDAWTEKPTFSRVALDPYTKKEQFYSAGASRLALPAGKYQIRAWKGLEYRVGAAEAVVVKGKGSSAGVEVKLQRWIDLPKAGWYSADSHIHVARPEKALNAGFARWMQGEDVHVATFLQWGHSQRFANALQYAIGPASHFTDGDYLLASGQENPRTNFLGHAVVLGAKSLINFPDEYLTYRAVYTEARRQGALAGFAHGGRDFGSGIDYCHGLVDFMEVLQKRRLLYDAWYDLLNTGLRLTPTAGTDFMGFEGSVPGKERFYAQVRGRLTYEGWLEAIRRGRTFVTNGPVVELSVEGKAVGDELVLPAARAVRVDGRVRFDPDRDDVRVVELIQNGKVAGSCARSPGSAEIACRLEIPVEQSSWLALRASGPKVGPAETSAAHTAAIYITVKGSPELGAQPRSRELAKMWMSRLDDLEKSLGDANLDRLSKWPGANWDGVDPAAIRKYRPSLLAAIADARKCFAERAP